MMNEQNPQIEVAHTKDEMLHILESMRLAGYRTEDIHIIAKDQSQFEDIKWDVDVRTHEAGNWVDQFKSWFTGESAVTEGLKRFDLTEGQTAYYAQLVEQGAIVLFAERDDTSDPLTTATYDEANGYRHNPLDPRVTAPEPFDTVGNVETSEQREERLKAEERMNDAEQIRRYL
ncbi:general stress protein [Lysinibacillus parviboronicapiens]|uniref:general stress protein n=1 Tax=Lysinibacillus parviboronicapiens TaxID=436516 RepID=UPI000D38910D|nr:general stress protein [Lysinibacillus parviboronicapiens]